IAEALRSATLIRGHRFAERKAGRAASEAVCEPPVERQCAAPVEGNDAREADREQVILEALGAGGQAAEPVHEEPVRRMGADGAGHDADDTERCESAAEAEQERERGDEL